MDEQGPVGIGMLQAEHAAVITNQPGHALLESAATVAALVVRVAPQRVSGVPARAGVTDLSRPNVPERRDSCPSTVGLQRVEYGGI